MAREGGEAKVKAMEVEPTVVFSAASTVEGVEETTAAAREAAPVGAVEEGVLEGAVDLVDATDRCLEEGIVEQDMGEVGQDLQEVAESALETVRTA